MVSSSMLEIQLRCYAERVTRIASLRETRLLKRKPDGDIVFIEFSTEEVPAYAILSYTWLVDK
jgi:hypothetical protein